MSKVARYVAVAVAAFLLGGMAFRLAADGMSAGVKQDSKPAAVREFAVDGMMCQGCVDSITSALKAVPGVTSAEVSLADKKAVVSGDPAQAASEKIVAAIEAAGYKAQLVSKKKGDSPLLPERPGGCCAQMGTVPFSSNDAAIKPTILVNITRGKNDLHAVSMALGLARSAIKSGRQAVVFLNVEAPIFATKDLSDDVKFGDFPPIKQMLADFVAAGGRVLVCGHCAHVVKVGPQDLISGAKTVAQDELLAATPPGTVVFSY